MPETPTACALDWFRSDTSSVLIFPVSTISTTFTSSRPVTRTPSTNSLLPWPSFSIVCVISGPPPCTTMGRRPALRSRLMSFAKLALSESFTIAAPPYFTTARVLVNSRDVAERLDEERALEAGAVVREPVVARDGPVGRRVREARVVGVDLHVVVREVAAPRDGAAPSPSASFTSMRTCGSRIFARSASGVDARRARRPS